jgi:hypothetical protein
LKRATPHRLVFVRTTQVDGRDFFTVDDQSQMTGPRLGFSPSFSTA